MAIKIVTDSSANLFSFPGVTLESVPMRICNDQKEYVDNQQLDVDGMVDDLLEYKGKTTTACPAIGDWMDAFRDGDEIFAITITSGLSGSYNAAMAAADQIKAEQPGKKIYVIDSLSAGPELVLLVEKIKEYIQENLSFEEICEKMASYQQRTHLVFSLESVENFARNGRINPALAKIIGLLGIRLVGRASAQGTLEMLHKCKGEKKALATLWEEMKAHGFVGGKVRIAHCNNPGAVDALVQTIRSHFPQCDVSHQRCNGLCSFYAQSGGLLVGFDE